MLGVRREGELAVNSGVGTTEDRVDGKGVIHEDSSWTTEPRI